MHWCFRIWHLPEKNLHPVLSPEYKLHGTADHGSTVLRGSPESRRSGWFPTRTSASYWLAQDWPVAHRSESTSSRPDNLRGRETQGRSLEQGCWRRSKAIDGTRVSRHSRG